MDYNVIIFEFYRRYTKCSSLLPIVTNEVRYNTQFREQNIVIDMY